MTVRDVTLRLSQAEALVLFELLSLAEDATEMPPLGEPERKVIWRLHGQLEESLVDPLKPDYAARLESARSAVVADGAPTNDGLKG